MDVNGKLCTRVYHIGIRFLPATNHGSTGSDSFEV